MQAGSDVQALSAFHTDFHLLDSYVKGVPGGSGETFAWGLAAEHRRTAPGLRQGERIPLILSGGLTPENVGDAIRVVQPFAVDVASGVELSPGIKIPERMRAFAEAVAATYPVEPELAADELDSVTAVPAEESTSSDAAPQAAATAPSDVAVSATADHAHLEAE